MVTTIQVSDTMQKKLSRLKGKKTYDEYLREVFAKERPPSAYGAFKGSDWTKEDRMQDRYD